MSTSYTKKERAALAVMLLLLLSFLLFLYFFPKYELSVDETSRELFEMAVSRLLGGGIFLSLMVFLDLRLLALRRNALVGLLLSIPAFLIAVNNFPILGLALGTVRVTAELPRILLFTAAVIGIGFFEEVAFRGVVFPMLLPRVLRRLKEKEPESPRIPTETKAVFLSIVLTSLVFALVHVLNLFAGGSPGGVLLQIGYSFLIGGMCAIVLLKTRCVAIPVLIHAIYDFGGLMFRYLCEGALWDTPTVILTAVFGVAIGVYFLVLLVRVKPEEVEALIKKTER